MKTYIFCVQEDKSYWFFLDDDSLQKQVGAEKILANIHDIFKEILCSINVLCVSWHLENWFKIPKLAQNIGKMALNLTVFLIPRPCKGLLKVNFY